MFKDKAIRILPRRSIWKSLIGDPLSNVQTVLGSDLRSLALFRIFIAASSIFDLINRSSDLTAHYSDWGVMPRSLVLAHFQNDLWISFHMMSGLPSFIFLCFMFHAMFAFGMMIGYRTKLCTIMNWVMTLSLQNRNILVLHGGDLLARQLLFFGMFLPLGDCYSIDNAFFSKHNRNLSKRGKLISPNHYRVISVATLGIGLQLSCMYVTSYLHKTGLEWTTWRTATWLALQLDYFRTPFGDLMLNFPNFLKYMTAAVLWWEGFGVLFWFIPLFSGPLRTFGTLGFFTMHWGFTVGLRLGQFGCFGMFGVLCMLPSWFWEEVIFRKLRTKERLGFKLYYDPSRTISTNLAIACENFFLIPETQVLPRSLDEDVPNQMLSSKKDDDQSYTDKRLYRDEESIIDIKPSRTYPVWNNSFLVVQDYKGIFHADYDALISICLVSPLLWPCSYFLRLRPLAKLFRRIRLFDWIETRKIIPATPPVNIKSLNLQLIREFWKIMKMLISNFVCLLFLLFILSWNANNIGKSDWAPPNNIRWIAWFFHIDQSWAMFSPRPPNTQWFYVIDGELDNGTSVELFKNEGMFRWEPTPGPNWDKPDPFYKSFKNHRWFKYYENGINTHTNNDQLRLNWGRYICREFNARHFGKHQIYKFTIWWMSERAEPDKPRIPQAKQNLWNHVCYDKPK